MTAERATVARRTRDTSRPTFDTASCRNNPAALYVRDENGQDYTEHATMPNPVGGVYITVCGKRAVDASSLWRPSWHIANQDNTFNDVTMFTEPRDYDNTNPITGEHYTTHIPAYVSPLACEECVRRVYGYVRCPDCIPDYSVPSYAATAEQRNNWIASRKRGTRCPTHQDAYDSRAVTGEATSEDHVIVIHNENRKEHIRLTAHVRTVTSQYYTLCGVTIHTLRHRMKYGFLSESIRYSARNLTPFRKGRNAVCRRCENAMRKAGYATQH